MDSHMDSHMQNNKGLVEKCALKGIKKMNLNDDFQGAGTIDLLSAKRCSFRLKRL
jgi:DNA-directed RNA polymerase specialized sigma subunit